MREHEFRVFNKNKNEMYYLLEDRWSFGPYEEVRAVSWEDVFAARYEGLIPLQYTGLKDSEGRKIFEGDLVEHEMEVNGVWEEYEASPVVYDEEYAMFCFESDAPNNLTDCYRNLKVVGNIYEQ